MSRPSSDTEEGKRATKKWRETMIKRYGKDGWHKQMVEMGRKGGSICCSKGFSVNRELASRVGRIGGTHSKRGPAKEKK